MQIPYMTICHIIIQVFNTERALNTNLPFLPLVVPRVGTQCPSVLLWGACLLPVEAVRLTGRPGQASVPLVFVAPEASSPLVLLSYTQPVVRRPNYYRIDFNKKVHFYSIFLYEVPHIPFGNFCEYNNYIRKSFQFVFSKRQIDMLSIFKSGGMWENVIRTILDILTPILLRSLTFLSG